MLHACFTPIALCFVYTSWHFYAFSRTNLLTRCHSASSCFVLFLCFRKVTWKIFSELDETKAKVPIYLTWIRSPKEGQRAARRQPHHRVARATPGHAARWCGPWSTFWHRPSTYKFPLSRKTLRGEHFSMKYTASRHHRRPEIGRV
jgi:hypothetical protein